MGETTEERECLEVHWQWLHRTGWRSYPREVCATIEEEYDNRIPEVKFMSGKKGNNPMKICFATMQQLDETTQNLRPVRRQELVVFKKEGPQEGQPASPA